MESLDLNSWYPVFIILADKDRGPVYMYVQQKQIEAGLLNGLNGDDSKECAIRRSHLIKEMFLRQHPFNSVSVKFHDKYKQN